MATVDDYADMTAEELLEELQDSQLQELHIKKRSRSWEGSAKLRFGRKTARGRTLPELIDNLMN